MNWLRIGGSSNGSNLQRRRLRGVAAIPLALFLAVAGTGCSSEDDQGRAGTAGAGGSGGEGGTNGEGGSGGEGGMVATVDRVEVTADETSVLERQTITLQVKAFDAEDQELTGWTASWRSENPAVATVDDEGVVTTIRQGSVAIVATVGDVSGHLDLDVREAEIVSFELESDSSIVPVDGTLSVDLVIRDENGSRLLGRSVTWSSSEASIASVDDSGKVTGIAVGTSTIAATLGDFHAEIDLGVEFRFVEVVNGEDFLCGLTAAGSAWCWGDNWYGQLGNGELDDSEEPVRAGAGLTFTMLTAGESFVCGISTDGSLWCWGENSDSQLGRDPDSLGSSADPLLMEGFAFTTVSAMAYGVCGLDLAGFAHCWGYNSDDFELGVPDNVSNSITPLAVSAPVEDGEPLEFTILRTGRYFSCGLTPASQLYCWGYNSSGQQGDGTTDSVARPKEPLPGKTVLAFGLGESIACAVTSDETTYCWGENGSGQIDSTDEEDVLEPRVRFEASTFVPVHFALWDDHACALDAVGTAWCWGENYYGELGREASESPGEPAPIDSGELYVSLVVGYGYTCGLAADGELTCWGRARVEDEDEEIPARLMSHQRSSSKR